MTFRESAQFRAVVHSYVVTSPIAPLPWRRQPSHRADMHGMGRVGEALASRGTHESCKHGQKESVRVVSASDRTKSEDVGLLGRLDGENDGEIMQFMVKVEAVQKYYGEIRSWAEHTESKEERGWMIYGKVVCLCTLRYRAQVLLYELSLQRGLVMSDLRIVSGQGLYAVSH